MEIKKMKASLTQAPVPQDQDHRSQRERQLVWNRSCNGGACRAPNWPMTTKQEAQVSNLLENVVFLSFCRSDRIEAKPGTYQLGCVSEWSCRPSGSAKNAGFI